ncbi:MAG: adenine phosphoribosyltransferase [Actinomycetota bacterium]|jgi:adenine phosphoribosyltransferase
MTLAQRLGAAIGHVADFPRPGFPFRDVTPLLESDPSLLADVVDAFAAEFRDAVDCVVCIESFGYVFGAPLSYVLGTRTALARRAGKLPRATFAESYDMIYDEDRTLELHQDAIRSGDRVLIIDDVLASGGSALATVRLVERAGGTCVGIGCVAEVPILREMPARVELAQRVPRVFALAEI